MCSFPSCRHSIKVVTPGQLGQRSAWSKILQKSNSADCQNPSYFSNVFALWSLYILMFPCTEICGGADSIHVKVGVVAQVSVKLFDSKCALPCQTSQLHKLTTLWVLIWHAGREDWQHCILAADSRRQDLDDLDDLRLSELHWGSIFEKKIWKHTMNQPSMESKTRQWL